MKTQDLQSNLRKIVENIANETDAARQSELFREYLRVSSLFHNYSWGNQLLIWSHRPTATRVAGYQTWRKMDRFVRAGEKGIPIFAPMIFKRREAADPDGLVTVEKAHLLFKVAYLFISRRRTGNRFPTCPRAALAMLATWSSSCVHSLPKRASGLILARLATPRGMPRKRVRT